MSFCDEPVEQIAFRTLTGKLVDIEASHIIPKDIVQAITWRTARPGELGEVVLRASMKVAAFGEMKTDVRFSFPASWQEMLRQRLKQRWPRMCRFVRDPTMRNHWKDAKTFERVCPHLAQGRMPSQGDCIEFVTCEMPSIRDYPP